jgi:hypothetical protein
MKKDRERLLTSFCRGVAHPHVSGFEVLELLDTRSALAHQEGELSGEVKRKLEKADSLFLAHAQQFYATVTAVADLKEMRKKVAIPPSHWWWYLEKVGRVQAAV